METAVSLPNSENGELRGMEQAELWRTMRVVSVLRVTVAVALLATGLGLVLAWGGGWRGWTLAATGALLGVLALGELRRPRGRAPGSGVFVYLYWTVVGFHTAVIVVTGGIDSPFAVLYLPVAVIAAVGLGTWSAYLVALTLPIALVWLLALGPVTGFLPDLRLAPFLPEGGGASSAAFTLTFALVLTVGMFVGGGIAIALRRALQRSQRALGLAREEAVLTMRERNRELVDISGALAHELKNPLASIQGLADLVRRKLPADGRQAEQMEVLAGEVRRMGAILEEFLNFSRPAVGLAVREVSACALVEEVVSVHEGLARRGAVALRAACDVARSVRCDPRKVKQVLGNLLQNALDATPPGGAVTVRATAGAGGGVVFTVEDTGPGLADEVRGRLFTPGATTKPEGSGLGLRVARSIAEQHGGSLRLEERPEGGCRAVCVLPQEPNVAEGGQG